MDKHDLISQLGSPDNHRALQAAHILRERGWLNDGSLRRAALLNANLQSADLRGADLTTADLMRANLSKANLSGAMLRRAGLDGADLRGADLSAANLQTAMLHRANLEGATLRLADLEGARDLSTRQLIRAGAMRGVVMPDGYPYDGRFMLKADLAEANGWLNVRSPRDMSRFYGIPVWMYMNGQKWARETLPLLLDEIG